MIFIDRGIVKKLDAISLAPGISISVGDQYLARFGFKRCDKKGCFGAISLDQKMLKMLRAGKEARVRFLDGNGQEITAPLSLQGFSTGFDSLK